MKLFKSSKKKKESESNSRAKAKSRSGLFGSRKKNVPQTKDARSSSFSSQTDTAITMSPQWLHGNGFVNVNVDVLDNASNHNNSNCNSDSSNNKINSNSNSNSKISCHDQTLAERFGDVEKNSERNNPFDEGGGENDVYHTHPSAISSSGSEGSDSMGEGDMESSAEVLTALLAHLTEKEHKEWADGAQNSEVPPQQEINSNSNNNNKHGDLNGMLRQAVDRMDVEPNDVEVQRLGAKIVYHLSKLRHKAITEPKEENNCWYATEIHKPATATASDSAISHRGDNSNSNGYGEDEEEELIADTVDAILQAMEDFPDDEDFIENACTALETTSETRNIQSSAKRILEEVLMAIEGFADNPIVVSSSLGLLYNLCDSSNSNTNANVTDTNCNTNTENINSNDDLRRRLAKYALPSILHGIKEHRDDLELYTKGCRAMANFTKDDPNAQRVLACKEALGLRIISEGLKYLEIDNLDEFAVLQRLRLQSAAIRVLKNLSTHPSLEVKGKIALGGGAARIIDRLLEALVCTGKDLVENNYHVGEFEFRANEEGGPQEVDDEDEVGISLTIMRDALQTIENLANIESVVSKDDRRSPHMPTLHRSAAVDNNSSAEDIEKQLAKAVKPILNTIRQHPNRRSVQYYGLSCVQQLTISHADSIANHGGISTFLNVLSSTGVAAVNDSMVHERALSCLTGLLSPSSNANGLDLVASMETEDGLDAIFRTIRRYQSNTGVIEAAYESLFYLSCRVRVVLASIAGHHASIAGGVGANAARSLQSQLCLEENVFVMLGTLNQYFEASQSISQRGLGLLVNVHAFLTQKPQQQQQQRLQADILVSDGGIRLVLAVMRRHGLAVAIQEYGVGLLAGILQSAIRHNAIRCEFVDEEGISTVLAAMMIHPDHAAVQSHGCDVLIQLMAIDKHPMEDGYSETAAFAMHYKNVILEETNAVVVVQDSMERFRSHRGLQHFGSVLLQQLSRTPSKAASISTKLQSSILSHSTRISTSIRSSLE